LSCEDLENHKFQGLLID